MIDVEKLYFDGRRLNKQNGLAFYLTKRTNIFSFLIDVVGERRRRIKVTMQADSNHDRAHVHINNHGASFAIDTGELLAGDCDSRTRRIIESWICRHRSDLQLLWEIAKRGKEYRPIVERIRIERSFNEMGFSGKEPRYKTVIRKTVIWHDDEIITESNDDGTITIIGDGDLLIGLALGNNENDLIAESLNGEVVVRSI